MPHMMYFSGNAETVTKIKHVPYQTVQLMDDTSIQVFIDNGATLSILPLSTYNKYPVLQKIQRPKVPHPSIQEVAQFSSIFG